MAAHRDKSNKLLEIKAAIYLSNPLNDCKNKVFLQRIFRAAEAEAA